MDLKLGENMYLAQNIENNDCGVVFTRQIHLLRFFQEHYYFNVEAFPVPLQDGFVYFLSFMSVVKRISVITVVSHDQIQKVKGMDWNAFKATEKTDQSNFYVASYKEQDKKEKTTDQFGIAFLNISQFSKFIYAKSFEGTFPVS